MRDKEETEREEKKNVSPSHHPLLLLVPIILHSGPGLRYAEPWKKPAYETVELLLDVGSFSSSSNTFCCSSWLLVIFGIIQQY